MRKLLFAALTVLALGAFAAGPALANGQDGQGQGNTGQGAANGNGPNPAAADGGDVSDQKGHERDDNGHPND